MSRLTIFEGPDGGGKSTTAAAYATLTGAPRPFHHGAYLEVSGGMIAAAYAVSMIPAVMGQCDVVLDRAWQSEAPYGLIFRGVDRLVGLRDKLDRLALMADVVVVLCLPPVEACLEAYRARKGEEYLPNEDLLRRVHAAYAEGRPSWGLPSVLFDRTQHCLEDLNIDFARERPAIWRKVTK